MILYHGSCKNLDIIKPFECTNRRAAVYASIDFNFALCYASKQWNDLILNQSYYNNQLTLTELKENVFEDIFDIDGYIYQIDSNDFIKVSDGVHTEYYCFHEVNYINKIHINSVLNEIKQSNIILYEFSNKPF